MLHFFTTPKGSGNQFRWINKRHKTKSHPYFWIAFVTNWCLRLGLIWPNSLIRSLGILGEAQTDSLLLGTSAYAIADPSKPPVVNSSSPAEFEIAEGKMKWGKDMNRWGCVVMFSDV